MSTLIAIGGFIIGLLGFIFGLYQYIKHPKERKKIVRVEYDEKKAIANEEKLVEIQFVKQQYKNVLREELNKIGMTGPEFDRKFLTIDEAFVSLRLSQSRHCETRFDKGSEEMSMFESEEIYSSPEQVMKLAFQKFRFLLIIGDPGAGKTTLLQYYAINCLNKEHSRLGFEEKEIPSFYFPLREIKFSGNAPLSIQDNLASWSKIGHMSISPMAIKTILQENKTLVLFDGLDEISDSGKRRKVCQWVKRALSTYEKAHFVLTSRPTGYRKLDGVELECEYLRVDIMDFSSQQQELFLNQWFRAVYLKELSINSSKVQKKRKEEKAIQQAKTIIDFLNKEENKSIKELARIPMLLQIMAILWKDRDYLPGSRGALYNISLNYLLEFRDQRRNLNPLLSAEKARIILAPTALWMMETLKRDYAAKNDIHKWMQPFLHEMDKQPDAQLFCENLRDRTGLISDYGNDYYIFRHKSFMEFLAALRLLLECREVPERIECLVISFNDDWWEETLRFFICKSDGKIFDRFMQRFFFSNESRYLDANKERLLQQLVNEAPQRKIDSMVQCLMSGELNENQKRYILNCLKIIDTRDSITAVDVFLKEKKGSGVNLILAKDILGELGGKYGLKIEEKTYISQIAKEPRSKRNILEDNVEYIKIPGGTYKFSVSNDMETIPDFYFCKYLVTNKRYRRFISYIEGKQIDIEKILPLKMFCAKLLEFSGAIKRYKDYLGTNFEEWQYRLCSRYEGDKRFRGDDQPVVGVSWYAACAYCFWLSCLHWKVKTKESKIEKSFSIEHVANIYRLPSEKEWEWAAGGVESNECLRKYPWGKCKLEPTPTLANYDENVGVTTPVGIYPEGATPEGLMDMAGNVWEWMGNWLDEEKKYISLRGGSWVSDIDTLRCTARHFYIPDCTWDDLGFRVICTQP